jgi:tRNA threonylcarbamoyladenosine biosynthesis protein TsaB
LPILSLYTATGVATVCVSVDGVPLAETAVTGPSAGGRSTGAQHVLADVDHVMRAAGVEPGELEAIVVGTGPGTYTGLRIGIASARALGSALGVPVLGVSTLDALLAGGVEVACIDARRGEVFAAGAGIERSVCRPDELAERIPEGAVVAGDGAVRYRAAFAGAEVPADRSPLHVPWARHHAALRDRAGAPDPVYLRVPDAERALVRETRR